MKYVIVEDATSALADFAAGNQRSRPIASEVFSALEKARTTSMCNRTSTMKCGFGIFIATRV
jgi:hypothetical protein